MTNIDIPSPQTLRNLFQYDPANGILYWKARAGRDAWNARWAGRLAFTALSDRGYKRGVVMNYQTTAHRVAWAVYYNEWPRGQIDHINGNTSDNRILNLREVNASHNQRNAKKHSHNTSGHNGVYWHKQSGKWQARVQIDGKNKSLGYFDSIQGAVEARKRANERYGFTHRHGI